MNRVRLIQYATSQNQQKKARGEMEGLDIRLINLFVTVVVLMLSLNVAKMCSIGLGIGRGWRIPSNIFIITSENFIFVFRKSELVQQV